MVEIETDRLRIVPMTPPEITELINKYKTSVPELSNAYSEMLANCTAHPEQYLWYTTWRISTRENHTEIGYAGFKGLRPDGSTEIGYGIDSGYEGLGYATEAAAALCHWALAQDGVRRIEAETTADNKASLHVLQKIGFLPTGESGKEGPRFVYSGPES